MAVRLAALLPWRVAQALYGHGSAPIVDPSREVASRASILTESPPAHAAGFSFPNPIPAIPFLNTDPMQRLIPINVGQQANDRSGDPLRDGIQGQRELRQGDDGHGRRGDRRGADQRARGLRARYRRRGCPPCRRTGPAAWRRWTRTARCPPATCPIPCRCRKRARPVAWRRWTRRARCRPVIARFHTHVAEGRGGRRDPLDAAGKVPVAHLPKLDYLPVIQRGAPDGVARWTRRARCRRPTCRRRRTPFRWRRKASQWRRGAGRRRQGAGGAAASDRIDSHGLRGLGAEAGGSGRAGFPAMGSSCRGRRFRIWRRPSRMALSRSCPRPSGWRIRSSVAPRSAMGQPAFACRTTTASLQARLARPFSEAMAPCPWTMARSRPARTRLMPTRSNPRSIWGRKRGLPPSSATTTVTPVFLDTRLRRAA